MAAAVVVLPRLVADGTTPSGSRYAVATGLTIAVICFIAYNYFSARLRTVTGETEQAATRLMNTLTDLRHMEAASHDHRKEEPHGVQTAARA